MNRLLLALALLAGRAAAATSPLQTDLQSKLLDAAGDPRRGTFSLAFSLYAAPSGGTALWSETQGAVPVENGVFDVKLGNVSALPPGLFSGTTLYLEVKVGAEAPMAPRQPVLMTPYALRALMADALVPGDTDYLLNGSALQGGAVFHVSSGAVEGSFLATGVASFTATGGAVYGLAASSGVRVLDGVVSVEGSGGLVAVAGVSAATATASTGLFLPQGQASDLEGSARWEPTLNLLFIGTSTAHKTMADADSAQTLARKTLHSTGGNLVDATHLTTRAIAVNAPSQGMILKWNSAASKWVPAIPSTTTVFTHPYTPTGNIAMTANVIYLMPVAIPGVLQLNQIRYAVGTSRNGCSGDVGLYNSAGDLVAGGGTSSATCATTGTKTVTVPGAPVTVYPGQYYAAITVNSNPSLRGVNLAAATVGVIKGLGTAAETGGTTLPASVNLGTVTDGALAFFLGFNN